ncbi:MAG: BLUF domain-containing protein [Bacteroidota bacterium]|jgi:hypothetical protein
MYELVYRSTANRETTREDIANILKIARIFNAENDITGCLLFHNNEFVQILEGDKTAVKGLFAKIAKDDRHTKVLLLAEDEIEERLFEKWSMAYHEVSTDDMINVERLLFVNNLLTFSELIAKPTHSSKIFWYIAKQLLKE